ncbi:MAG: GspH/FimT family pseudopilin [Gammaproteobacteria bacterium]
MPTCRPSSGAGFTLMELLVTISIAGIMAMIAVPSFNALSNEQHAKNTATNIYIGLLRARSEALKFNQSVSISPKAGGWQNGWQIANTGTGAVLEDQGPLKGLTITATTGPGTIVYNSYGRVQGGKTSLQLTTTDGNPVVSRCVTVGPSGRPYIKASSCS